MKQKVIKTKNRNPLNLISLKKLRYLSDLIVNDRNEQQKEIIGIH